METKVRWRLFFLSIVVLSGALLAAGATSATTGGDATGRLDSTAEGASVAPARDGITVVATDSNTWLGEQSDGPRASAQLVAVGPSGDLIYENDTHTRYWDVDPVPGTNATVEYVYADHLNKSECGGDTVCTRNGIERANLTTGEVTEVYERVTPGKHSTRWHDADRVNETHVAVADIRNDRVFIVDTETGLVEWAWNAQTEYRPSASGGPFPGDWTHLNDVEVLDDGRIMVSLRNHDQVVFLDRETGVIAEWTLGSDDRHDVMYEQHNPDYIPEERGGPSVLLADSESNRVVEYHRDDGSWERTWTWRDSRLQWPRDADRLPNGHTLVTDSNGNRVLEVDERGRVVWQFEVAFPYEAERLHTGDESAGGPASDRAGLDAGSAGGSTADSSGDRPDTGSAGGLLAGVASGPVANAVAYVLPVWMGTVELVALAALCLAVLGWIVLEWRWASIGVSVRQPIEVKRRK